MEMANADSQPEETKLIDGLYRGDTIVLEQLYQRYFNQIYSLVFNQVGRDHSITEDIVQETFLAAINSASKFRGQSKVSTWLYSIACHKVTDHYRRQGREAKYKAHNVNISDIEVSQNTDGKLFPARLLESEETRQLVEQALSRLPLDYRQVLILKYVVEIPVAEISQIMERSQKSVEGLLTRARKSLRANLAELDKG